ncbi:MAG: RecX family transcriptional regulator [Dehalococcoidia bacterium]|nr:RecX family transcriptional regulator [Dehalococcoidia bacterium]
MSRITAIRTGRKSGKRVNIFLDSRFAFSLEAEAVVEQGLRVDQELSEDQVTALARTERHSRCFNAATRFLTYRPRSESELRERLYKRGFSEDGIEAAIARLKDQGFVDDVAFARFWKENRDSFSPRSQWLTGLELKKKGVAADVIDEVVRDTDDGDSAYRAALDKAHRLPLSDYEIFRRRLGEFLKRRGFSYDVISRTVRRLWQELKTEGQAEA